jgi:hypothetical protein
VRSRAALAAFWGALAVALLLLCKGATTFGVLYEAAQFQLRHHPETLVFEHEDSTDTRVRPMKSEALLRGELLGHPVVLRRFEERPVLLLEVGAQALLVASSNYAHLLVQNLDLLAAPLADPPLDARCISVLMGLAYLAIVHALTRALLGPRVALMTLWLLACNYLFSWEFGSGHTQVTSTVVLLYLAVFCLYRSLSGSRLWLGAAFVALVIGLTAKITATGYVCAIGLSALFMFGPRATWTAHRRQWMTVGLALAIAWLLIVTANALLMDTAFYRSGGKLSVNLAQALREPWNWVWPVVHQLAILTAAPAALTARSDAIAALLLVLPALAYTAGAIGLVRLARGASDPGMRRVGVLLICDAVLLCGAGVFYYRDFSFDFQLFALPCIVAALSYGADHGFVWGKWSPSVAAVAISVAACVGLLRALPRAPQYGLTLATQKQLLATVQRMHPKQILTIDPVSAYALKWLEPRLPIVYFEGAHWRLRHGDRASVVPALRSLLDERTFPMVIVPEHPLFEMRRGVPWEAIKSLLADRYGQPLAVRDGDHEAALVYSRPAPQPSSDSRAP